MKNTSKAVVMTAPGKPLEIREITLPDLEPGAMLMKPIYSEVCGTDVHLHHGRLSGVPYPIIPGHVSVGRVGSLRGTAKDIYGVPFAEGDLITFLDVHETCGSCWHCLVGKSSTRCPSRKVYGITYSSNDGLLGGWSEQVHLKAGVKAIRIPDGLSPETFIGGGCGAPTAFHAIQRATIKLNDTVLVQGTGPVGLSCIAFARISGAGTIIAIGAPADRLQLAREMGADIAIDLETASESDRLDQVMQATSGRGADVAVEATGNPQAVPEGLRLVRDAGIYVIVGQYTDCGDVAINPHTQINRKHVDIRGCWGSDYSHFHGAVEAMARHQNAHPWSKLAQWQYPLESAPAALADVEARKVPKAVIRITTD
jgi:threonine dehydrogenase-like Zn-dependent dehydrogenase